jgi:hypothetical protein
LKKESSALSCAQGSATCDDLGGAHQEIRGRLTWANPTTLKARLFPPGF